VIHGQLVIRQTAPEIDLVKALRARERNPVIATLTIVLLSACGGGSSGSNPVSGPNTFSEWLIPTALIADGGPGQDGIPALENPNFESIQTISTVEPNDLLVVLLDGDQVKAYPHDILDYHEIVNDGSADAPFVMSYCPLTGSAVAWKGNPGDADPTFGVSGLLYNSNLMLYDRETQTIWSQLLETGVNGPRIRDQPESKRMFETTFETLQAMFPNAMVMTRDTGHIRGYDDYPYGSYKTDTRLLFRVGRQDNRLHPKQRVIGIHEGNDTSKTYQLGAFGSTTQVINDQFEGHSIVVVGNSSQSFAAIYSRELPDGTILNFTAITDDLPNVMQDDEGNVWDIFGRAVSGPRVGVHLAPTRSFVAMWFAWVSHFNQIEINFN
jgi:hypothetical protein